MPLYVALNSPNADDVKQHLRNLVACDIGLSFGVDAADPFLAQVWYSDSSRTQSGVAQDLIAALANQSQTRVVIYAVGPTYVLPDGEYVYKVMGETSNIAPGTVDIHYDPITNYWVMHDASMRTTMPPELLLFHELSHAFHFCNGSLAATENDRELQAIAAENDLRASCSMSTRATTPNVCGIGPSNGEIFPGCV